jgi:tetratricopeptide (TPR) repeat protein
VYKSDPSKALDLLDKAKKLQPNRPNAYINSGLILYQNEKVKKAGQEFKKGLDLVTEADQRKDVIAFIDKVTLAFKSEEEYNLFKQAYDLIEKGYSATAIENLKKASKLNPGNAQLYYEMGYAYIEIKDLKNAASILEEGRSINPSSHKILKELVYVYSDIGKSDRLQDVIRDMIKYYGDDPALLHELAYSYEQDKKRDLAISTLEKNISKFPKYYHSYYFLGTLYFKQKNYKQATAVLEAYVANMKREDFAKINSGASYDEIMARAKKLLEEMKKSTQ